MWYRSKRSWRLLPPLPLSSSCLGDRANRSRASQTGSSVDFSFHVSLPAFTDELFPQDKASMLKSRLTFKEAIESPDYSLMSRHRLKVAQREFYSRLDSLAV